MKKRSKLKLHRETIAALDPKHLQVAGANCTCSCCYTDCCPPPYNCPTYSCDTCNCGTDRADSICICI